jgi:hypothetical protein
MTGFIGVGQLRYILTNLGEKMSDEEVDELLKAVDTSSGEINYTGMFVCPLQSTLRKELGDGVEGRRQDGLANRLVRIDLVRTILAN